MLNKEKQLNIVKSNAGFSLIETIVSLLILTIIIAPILNMFVFNAQTNRRAAEQQAATSVGANIMEDIKVKGVKKWTGDMGWDLSTESLSFNKNQGGFPFEVEVTCHTVEHAGNPKLLWNKYQMADISNLNRKTTAIADPFELFVAREGAGDSQTVKLVDTYDDMAATEFRNNHMEEMYKHWSDYVAGLEEDEDTPPSPKAYTIEEIKQKIVREIIITVVDDPKKFGEERQVSVVIKYSLFCDVEYHYGTNLSELPYDKTWTCKKHEREYSGFYDNIEFEQLKDVYLFHTPLVGGAGAWLGDSIIMEDKSRGSGATGKLFIVPQIYDLTMDTPCKVEIDPSNKWEAYYLSNNPDFKDKNNYLMKGTGLVPAYNMGDVAIATKENGLTEELPAEDRLYKITVSVKREGSDKELMRIDMEGR